MKKIIMLFFIFYSVFTYAQIDFPIDTVVKKFYYDYNYLQDSTDVSSEKYQEMVLLIGKHSSKFSSKNSLYIDSLFYAGRNKDINKVLDEVIPLMGQYRVRLFCNYSIYKNYPKKNNTRLVGDLGPKSTLLVDQKLDFNWKLVQNRDTTIGIYDCQMATCHFGKRDFIAWYTTEIPISDGPYKFKGLPGLIIRLTDAKNEHVFQLYKVQNVNSNQEIVFMGNRHLKATTAANFLKAQKAYLANLYKKFGGGSYVNYKDASAEAKTLRNIRAKNNFIEKY